MRYNAIMRGGGGNFLWLDFGFNHGGALFAKSSELNFTLTPQTSLLKSDKINLFSWGLDSNDKPYVAIGGLIYGSAHAWRDFGVHMQEAYLHFLSRQEFVDDQSLHKYCLEHYGRDCNLLLGYGWFDSLFYFIDSSVASKLSLAQATILNKTLNQDQILNYTKKRQIRGNYFKKLYLKLKHSSEKRIFTLRKLFRGF